MPQTKPELIRSKRGRPTRLEAGAIEEKILTAARHLFLEQGYAQTAMESVANAAGVSKATLYARYAEKGELFNAVLDERLKFWAEKTPEILPDPSVALSDRLFQFASKFLERMRDPEIAAFHYLLSAEAGRFPQLGKMLVELGQDGAADRLVRSLEAAAGGWVIVDAKSVAKTFIASMIGWFHTEARVKPLTAADCDAYASRLVAIFVGGRAGW